VPVNQNANVLWKTLCVLAGAEHEHGLSDDRGVSGGEEKKNDVGKGERSILCGLQPAREENVCQEICPREERLVENGEATFLSPG
jgi:hypothetical protein